MVKYKIQVKDGDGVSLGEFQIFRGLRFSKTLNNYGSCQFEVPINDPKVASLIALRRYTVWIYREDILIWAGEQAARQGSLDNKGDNWASITCYDWFEQLNTRYTGASRTFTGVDAGVIAWTLIDESQSETDGDLGITEGAIATTQDRDRVYFNQKISDAIIALSNVINGFDFEINTSKEFNVYESLGVDRSNSVILEYGVNVASVSLTEDFVNPVTRAIVLGDSGSFADPLRVERDDLTAQGLYKIRERIAVETTVSELGTLADIGDSLIRKYAMPLVKVSLGIVRLSPNISDFALGDQIRLIIKSGIYDINEKYRVFAWGVNLNTDNTETLTLTLGKFTIE